MPSLVRTAQGGVERKRPEALWRKTGINTSYPEPASFFVLGIFNPIQIDSVECPGHSIFKTRLQGGLGRLHTFNDCAGRILEGYYSKRRRRRGRAGCDTWSLLDQLFLWIYTRLGIVSTSNVSTFAIAYISSVAGNRS